MECNEVCNLIDSFLSEELLVETNHEILPHIETCSNCRALVAARRKLRAGIRAAFNNSEELSLSEKFRENVMPRVRASAHRERRPISRFVWAAGIAVAVVLIAVGIGQHLRSARLDTIALEAAGDHQNCAIQFRLPEKPISLEQAAVSYDPSFRLLESVPSDQWITPVGDVRVMDRHSCVFEGRRFAHIVLQFQGQVVSLLVTMNDREGVVGQTVERSQTLVSLPAMDGFQGVRFRIPGHSVFVIGNVGSNQLRELAQSVSGLLYDRFRGA